MMSVHRPIRRPAAVALVAMFSAGSLLLAPLTAAATPRSVPPAASLMAGGVAGFANHPVPAFSDDFDWSDRARDFDTFAYDWTDRGAFTTIMADSTAVNVPDGAPSYKMPAYYGDTRVARLGDHDGDGYQEAVVQMASVISATLVGIDKSDQPCAMPGQTRCNYVDMLQTFFHPDLGVAKDTPLLGHAGDGQQIPGTDDGWYAMIANVLYYMVGEQYPQAQHMQANMRSIADRFYDMTVDLGGADADFTMQDYDFADGTAVSGRDESADIASAVAAVELWAYEHFGDAEYLHGARWAMDFLQRQDENHYYEILPLLAPALAARMNARYGADYDIAKMVRWLMKDSATRGGWGTIGSAVKGGDGPEEWGGRTVAGLSGSRSDKGFDGDDDTTGYAFAMNSFATPWLAATAKYDTRYADTVGKWLLNVNDAARSYFADQLPAAQQQYGDDFIDGTSDGVPGSTAGWADDDRATAIAYEGLQPSSTTGIWATSDVPNRSGGWGVGADARGLGLYGSAWIGFMSVVHPTDVQDVLRTDLDALDTFGENAFPTSLYYNPGSSPVEVTAVAGTNPTDLYDTVTGTYLARSVTQSATIEIPARSSVVIVELPAQSTLETVGSTTFVNGAPVAYDTNPQRDLAAGAPVTADRGASTAGALTDGDDATAWVTSGSGPRSATLDLGASHHVGTVDLTWGVEHPGAYRVATSTDGEQWNEVAHVSASGGETESVTFTPTAARWIRVELETPTASSARYVLQTVSVYAADLALGRPVAVSDTANSINAPSGLTDGSPATRWESGTRDDVWARVDLGTQRAIGDVEIQWETAASKDYDIQVSNDATDWATVATVTDGVEGERRNIPVAEGTSARFVRVKTHKRATTWANSIYRLSVYGVTGITSSPAPMIPTTTSISAQDSSVTVDGDIVLTATVSREAPGEVAFYDGATLLGTQQLLDGEATWTVSDLTTGGRTFRAIYTGYGRFETSTSDPVTVRVHRGSVTLGQPAVSPSQQVAGAKKKDRPWVSTTVAGLSAGTVVFREGVHVIGSARIHHGRVRLRLPGDLATGTYYFTASVAASPTHQAATSPLSKAFTVSKAKLKNFKVKGKKKTKKHHKSWVKVKASKRWTNDRVAKGKVKVKVKKHGSWVQYKKRSMKKFRTAGGKLKIKIAKRFATGKKIRVKAVYKPKKAQKAGVKKAKGKIKTKVKK